MSSGKTNEDKIATAQQLKEEGNSFVKQQDYGKALLAYHKAWLYVKGLGDDGSGGKFAMMRKNSGQEALSSGQTSEIKAISLALHLNMALCHFKQDKFDRVIDDCNKALQLEPSSVKALFRRGQAYLKLRDSDKAAVDLNKAAQLDPSDKAIQLEIRRLKQFEKAQSDKQKKALAGLFDRMSAEEEKPPATSSAQQ
ncbi:tetratricopeptide repeat domain containing protein [Acanthamoeba castellanii str. Neff]|uniref:Tetratricopeptide repeat domain containing protein n=1 Tax=Acanthamoeba castellanii (strain ATCC 30010 / Neff) TaxID=1257118 RepID=L8H2H1_ACACF|nr:tetratricopeptide repeat domain containing protein [Acanthamoeba castellanii str. Neff]ELR19437.1 tetratricopeptide repeat domain containing protein [Acanthamoeba castellanii str. Neff]